MAQAMQGHRKRIGAAAAWTIRVNDELVGRVIAIKRRKDREAFNRTAEVRA